MSEIFPAARDQAPVVSLVIPIRDLDEKIIGIIGSAQRLNVIRQWLLPIQVPDGDLYVVDRKGQLVFHRTRFGPEQINHYSRVPVVERLLRGEEGVAELENPVEGEIRLSAYRLLPSLGWGVVVHREKSLVLQRARTLIVVSGAAGIFLAAALAFLGGVAVRNQRRTERALVALEEKTRELEAAQEELVRKERLAILGQLAGGVAHELRNPLGVVKNSVYYLKMVLPEDERARKHLHILDREVGTAGRIVADLLDFARVRPPVRTETDLNGLVGMVLERTPLGDHVEVLTNLAAGLPSVSVDPEQVKQVLGNLITNAGQAMPEGGTLTIETARADGGAQVVVSDTGVGIPPENLEKIFQPLFTTKAKGIGLGLAVAKGLAEGNGGTISVESALGKGSRFIVRFAHPQKEA
jgi:signal transduction histidine kinase